MIKRNWVIKNFRRIIFSFLVCFVVLAMFISREIYKDIQDEHDGEEAEDILRLGDDSYEFDGLVLLDEISELLNIEFDEPEEDTIGGFVFGLLGRKPEEGDRVVTGGWRFEVTEAEGFRVTRVKATRLQEDGTAVQADE